MESANSQALQTEVTRLREELQMRDQLVQQLSQELFRLVKGNAGLVPSPEVSDRHQVEVQSLRDQLQEVEQQVAFYQDQMGEREAEIYQLRQSVQELGDRSRMLEQVVQDLPGVYRHKFEDRMATVKEKLAQLQQENRNLQAELQSVSYRLAISNRQGGHLDLPKVSPNAALSGVQIPTFGNA
jgi:chromosome segregation ATPase